MRLAVPFFTCLTLATLFLSGSIAHAQFDELAKKIPASADAIAIVNMVKLMASPAAIKGKWLEKRDTAYASGVSFLPPDSKQAILAAQVDLHMWMPLWEAAILELDHEPSMDKVVEMTGGTADSIGGKQAVALPEDAYVLKFGKSTAAFMTPSNRQTIARWLREVDSRNGLGLSPYLAEAYSYANDLGTPVILAIDLEDSLTAESIKGQLQDSKEFLEKHKLQASNVAKVISEVRGMTLGITFAEKPFGKLKVDFKEAISLSPELAKAVMIHALQSHGVMIDEFEDWKPEVKEKQISLEGFLTSSGMQRLSTLFNRPPSLKVREVDPSQKPKTKEQQMLESSQAYFHRVTDLLSDLKKEKNNSPGYTMAQIGVWMNKYASKIDQLSVLNVDPELVEYGANVSESLRAAYGQIRGGAARSRTRQVETPMQYNYYSYANTYGYSYRSGYFGAGLVPYGDSGTIAVPNQQAYNHERTRVKTEERVSSGNAARDIVETIAQSTGEIRRKMTQKYQADF